MVNAYEKQALDGIQAAKKANDFWSTWAIMPDFQKIAKKRWDPAFLKGMIDRVDDVKRPIAALKKEITTLQNMKSVSSRDFSRRSGFWLLMG